MKMLKWIFGGLGAALMGFSAIKWYQLQTKAIKEISYKISKVSWLEKTVSNVKLEIFLEVTNPTDVAFKLTGYDLDVFIHGKKVANVKNSGVSLDVACCGQKSKTSFIVEFNPSDFLGTVRDVLKLIIQNVSIEVDVKGIVSVEALGGIVSIANSTIDVSYNSLDSIENK